MGTRFLQLLDGVCGKLGCEDGARCGQALRGVLNSNPDGDTRTRCGSSFEGKKDVRGCACFENCETEFRYSKCIREEGWRLQCVIAKSGQIRFVESLEERKARRWDFAFGGDGDDEYLFRGMMWAKSLWWTSTYNDEDDWTLKVGCKGNSWDVPFVEVFDLLGFRFRRNEKGIQWPEKKLRKGMGC